MLVCALHTKAKMAALTCFKNSRSQILTRPTRRVQRSKPIKKTDSRSVQCELTCCGWRETIQLIGRDNSGDIYKLETFVLDGDTQKVSWIKLSDC